MNQPTLEEIGAELYEKGYLTLEDGEFLQTKPNCFGIARLLAGRFGYKAPRSKDRLIEKVREQVEVMMELREGVIGESDAYLVLRNRMIGLGEDIHVTFQLNGREYNYGSDSADGLEIWQKLPLYKR